MTWRMTLPASLGVLVLALLPTVAGCKKKPATQPAAPLTPAKLTLLPAATVRADLLAAQVALPNLEKAMTAGAALAAKLGLPTQAADMKRALFAGKGIPPAALEQVDLARPLSVVVLASRTATATEPRAGVIAAVALKDPTAAGLDRWVASWAKVRGRDADAISVTTALPDGGRPAGADAGDPDGDGSPVISGWLLHRDGAVCAALTKETLVAGCLLAIEARRNAGTNVGPTGGPGEHLSVVLVPEGIARAQGTTLAQALTQAKASLAQPPAAPTATGGTTGAAGTAQPSPMAQAWMSGALDRLAEVSEVRLGVSLDDAKGLSIGANAVPRSGSTLAQLWGGRSPFVLDPAVLTGPAPAGLIAMGSSSWAFDMLAAMMKPSAPAAAGTGAPTPAAAASAAKDQAAIDAALATLRENIAGPASGRVRFAEGPRPELRYDFVYPLKDGLDAKQTSEVLDAWKVLGGGDWINRMLAEQGGPIKMKISSRRQGAMVITRMTVDTRSLPPQAVGLRGFPLFDGRPLETRVTVEGNRLLLTTGTDTRGGLEGLKLSKAAQAAEPPAPAGALGAALAEAKGEDGFWYVDLAPVLRAILISMEKGFRGAAGAAGGGAALSGPLAIAKQAQGLLANVELATWASHRAGDGLTVRWRWPTATFEAASGVVRQVMGMLSGAPPAPAP